LVNISKSDAAGALATIESAGARSSQVQRYRRLASYLITWGIVWLVANSASDFAPHQIGSIWLTSSLLGVAATGYLGWRQQRLALGGGYSNGRHAEQSWRWWLCFLVIAAFIVTTIAVVPPMGARQQDTFLSMFWTFLYLAIGIWAGWRLFTIGLVATILILVGFYVIHEHYFLYMGWVSGGALIAGGLWLRRL
jgi:hypothetical protein